MIGFEPQTAGARSDRSTNSATTIYLLREHSPLLGEVSLYGWLQVLQAWIQLHSLHRNNNIFSLMIMSNLVKLETCGESYKHFTLLNYDSRVTHDFKILRITTLES